MMVETREALHGVSVQYRDGHSASQRMVMTGGKRPPIARRACLRNNFLMRIAGAAGYGCAWSATGARRQ